MGRSQLTTSQKIERLTTHHFGDFQRALMSADKRAFDDLVAAAKNRRMAISQAVDILPVTAMLFTMVIELTIRITKLEKRLNQLEEECEQNKR